MGIREGVTPSEISHWNQAESEKQSNQGFVGVKVIISSRTWSKWVGGLLSLPLYSNQENLFPKKKDETSVGFCEAEVQT